MASIYEIEQAMLECVDMETGEVDVERLEALELERTEKIENVLLWIKNLKAEAEAIRSEEVKLAERRKAKVNRVDSLTRYLAAVLNGDKFNTARVSLYWRKSTSTDVYDETALPEKYRVETVTWAADKKAIKEAINSGEVVTGARLVEKTSAIIK